MAPASMMITSTCVETFVQSLPAPAATLWLDLTPAVPVSSPSYLEDKPSSHVWTPGRWRAGGALRRWTPLVASHTTDSAMTTARPPSPALTSANMIMDCTCVERNALRIGNLATEAASMMITCTCVETSAQSLPAPAAMQFLALQLAVPVSSPSFLMGKSLLHA